MYAVVRAYGGKGAKELFDLLEKQKSEVETVMRSVEGFVSYTLVRSGDGGYSFTVCADKSGVEESVKKAKEWVGKNAGAIGVGAPQSYEGTVITHIR
jgi:hypothetical protein